jgi:hypothetical protein
MTGQNGDGAITILPGWMPAQRPVAAGQWMQRGACASDPKPDRWIDLPPIRVRGKVNPAYQEKKAELDKACSTCPIQATCAWEALTTDVVGVWAGADEFDRRDLREGLGLPEPKPLTFSGETTERTDLDRQRFTARYLAAKTDLTLAAIAARMGVSPMTVTRILDERDPADVPQKVKQTA